MFYRNLFFENYVPITEGRSGYWPGPDDDSTFEYIAALSDKIDTKDTDSVSKELDALEKETLIPDSKEDRDRYDTNKEENIWWKKESYGNIVTTMLQYDIPIKAKHLKKALEFYKEISDENKNDLVKIFHNERSELDFKKTVPIIITNLDKLLKGKRDDDVVSKPGFLDFDSRKAQKSLKEDEKKEENDDEKYKKIEHKLTADEIVEMYKCNGGKPGHVMMSGIMSDSNHHGYKKEMKYGKKLSTMGLAHYHKTKKENLKNGGSIETAIGWYLTDLGDEVIDYIIDKNYEPYLEKIIFSNKEFEKKFDKVYSHGGDEIHLMMKDKAFSPSFSVDYNIKNKKLKMNFSGYILLPPKSIEDLDLGINIYKDIKEFFQKIEKEFKKLPEIDSFEKVYSK